MAALLAKLFVVRPVALIVPAAIDIPEPAVRLSWIPNPEIFALVILNFEKSIAALAITSEFEIVDLVASAPNPKFVLASDAVVAPVPPFEIPMVVPLQVPLVIVPIVFKFNKEVNVVFEVAVIFPAAVAVEALPKKLGAVMSLLNVFAPAIV